MMEAGAQPRLQHHSVRVNGGHPRPPHAPVVADVGVTTPVAMDKTRDLAAGSSFWWLFLFTGSLWLLFSIVIFRFDWTTVSSISILFGIVMLFAAVTELIGAFAEQGWWRVARLALGVAFGVIGIVAFVHPGDTFSALAAVMSFYFIFKGIFDVVVALAGWGAAAHSWLYLLLGVAEIVVGFWAAGDFGHRVILLVVWVGVTALTRGISEILLAFTLRAARDAES
jgi:uncharacterized membrane protein HdeD (DUF308 family)